MVRYFKQIRFNEVGYFMLMQKIGSTLDQLSADHKSHKRTKTHKIYHSSPVLGYVHVGVKSVSLCKRELECI